MKTFRTSQAGYMDMQFTPTVVGVVLLWMVIGMISAPDLSLVKLSIYLLLATAALLFGFAMHLISLGYPESPFNQHSSPLLMTPLCAVPLAYTAYRFYQAAMLPGAILYAVLALLVLAAAIGCAVFRSDEEQAPD